MLTMYIFMVLVNAIEFVVAFKLLIFHIYLKIKGMSTFEYIKRKDVGYKSRFVIRRNSIEQRRSVIEKSSIFEKSGAHSKSHFALEEE